MGGFFVNVFVRSDDQAAVVEAARAVLRPYYRAKRKPLFDLAWFVSKLSPEAAQILKAAGAGQPPTGTAPVAMVGPAMGGWVGLYDSKMENQDESMGEAVVKELSRRLKSTAITFLVHDGDILSYRVAVNGKVVDQFNSIPDYFDEDVPDRVRAALRGNPGLLAQACGKPEAEAQLQALLAEPSHEAYELLETLSAVLGLENACVGFDHLRDSDQGWDALVAMNPALAPMVEQQKAVRQQIPGIERFVAITAADLT